MEQVIEKAIELLAGLVTTTTKSEDALRFTQSALNLAHVLQVKKATSVMK